MMKVAVAWLSESVPMSSVAIVFDENDEEE